ncbi:carboxylesterase 5A isoform X2 [Scleropages formosus]|uniref:carboxylesterase 5A isoform X2 n=1 Tax=Scleropages formosus TaxID=113540 RepID=UPI000878B527|nr:carboxylesterase 5A-like isoform X2 [Scleropages formosus]
MGGNAGRHSATSCSMYFRCLQDKDFLALLMKNISIEMEMPETSEDCLYLNVYTPAKPSEDSQFPVMVWIHGGGFFSGGVSLFDGSALAAYENVVVVVIQYRLGILGFFSTEDEYAPGNFGLLDQVAALRWVQENIHSFGGNPKSVTIFGQSAGGASVSLQLLSPLSAGLFHRAIAQSGTARIKALFHSNPLPRTQAVANMSGCDITSTKKIVECMMQKTEEEMLSIQQQSKGLGSTVTVDGAFLTKPIDEIFQNHEFHKVPFMTGVTSQEFGWLLSSHYGPEGWVEGTDREEVMPTLTLLNPQPADPWINDLIADEYLGSSRDREAIRDGWVEMMGDMMFVFPAIETANFYRDAGVPVYLYEFRQPPEVLQKKRPSLVTCDHADDIFFVFGMCFVDGHFKFTEEFPEKDKKLSRTVMSYFGNFAWTGSPNGENLVPWAQYGKEAAYLEIGTEQRVNYHLKGHRYTFVTKTVQEKIRARQEQKEHGEL